MNRMSFCTVFDKLSIEKQIEIGMDEISQYLLFLNQSDCLFIRELKKIFEEKFRTSIRQVYVM